MQSGTMIEISSSDGQVQRAWLALPRQGSGPGLLLLHDIFGLNGWARETAAALAEEGYVVLVPDLYARVAPGLALAYDEDGRRAANAARAEVDVDVVLADLGAALAALRAVPAQRGGLGAVGHSFGGLLAVLAAARYALDGAVAYYPSGLDTHMAALAGLRCPLVVHLAEQDERVPEAVRAALAETAAGTAPLTLHVYPGVEHGFANPRHPAADKPARMMAHSRTLALLRGVLGPIYDLSSLWDAHTAHEFATRDVDATMATMVAEPYVNHVPTMTGGVGHDHLKRFYRYHFVDANPPDTRLIPVSRTIGVDRLVDEMVFCFTHTCEIPWMLPGIAPTGRYVEIPLVAIVNFRGDRLYHEHIYWDQASVLVQIGVLDPTGLPVAGIATAKKLIDERLPSNELMGKSWDASAGKPL